MGLKTDICLRLGTVQIVSWSSALMDRLIDHIPRQPPDCTVGRAPATYTPKRTYRPWGPLVAILPSRRLFVQPGGSVRASKSPELIVLIRKSGL
jgi:hypothetical protein